LMWLTTVKGIGHHFLFLSKAFLVYFTRQLVLKPANTAAPFLEMYMVAPGPKPVSSTIIMLTPRTYDVPS
jgi:hypothetical protein